MGKILNFVNQDYLSSHATLFAVNRFKLMCTECISDLNERYYGSARENGKKDVPFSVKCSSVPCDSFELK